MNVLPNDDENLSTADIVNPVRNRNDDATPRQVYAAGLEPSHNDRDPLNTSPAGDTRARTSPTADPNGPTPPSTNRTVVTTERYVLKPVQNDPPDYTPPQGQVSSQNAQNTPPDTQPGSPARTPQPVASPPPAAARASAPPPQPPAVSAPAAGPVAVSAGAKAAGQPGPLFPEDELHNYRARWDQVQTSFVDEPRKAVESADSLVANVVKRIAEQFANERETLEQQWDRGDSVNTEDLRQALKRYRAFFDRLLAF
jgi:hypothetical protein